MEPATSNHNQPTGPRPDFQDITLHDQETGEPFLFTAKEQEFFWRQGFTNVPKHTPERRRMLREKRFEGKELFNVTCMQCHRVGKILQKPPYPKQVLCGECFDIKWGAYLDQHPEERAIHEAAAQPAQVTPLQY